MRNFYWQMGAIWVAAAAACRPGTTVGSGDTTTPVVVITPSMLEDAVSYRIPARSAVDVTSADGRLTLRVRSESVPRDTQLTIARLQSDHTPKGVVGSAYLLSPELTRTLRPAHLTITYGALDPGVDAASLRLARLDTGGAYYQPANGQAVLSEQGLAGAALMSFGVFAVVDLSRIDVRDDVAPTAYWHGEHLLDLGMVEEAQQYFAQAVASAPSRQASYALAMTKIMNLLALPELDDFFLDCGEPLWRANAIFGPDGYFSELVARSRLATTHLRLGVGFDADNLLERAIEPFNTVIEPMASAECVETLNGQVALPPNFLRVTFYEPNYDGNGSAMAFTLTFDPTAPGAGVVPNGNLWVVPLGSLNGNLVGTIDNEETSQGKDPGSRPPGDAATGSLVQGTVGEYAPTLSSPGTIDIALANGNVGSVVTLTFHDLTLEPNWPQDPPTILRLSGTLTAPITEAPPLPELPLFDAAIGEVVERCASAVDDARLHTVVAALGREVGAIALQFEAALAGGLDFRYDLSLGILDLPGALPLGLTEADVLAGAFDLLHGAERLLSGYHWLSGDLRSTVVQYTVVSEAPCDDVCAEDPLTCTRSGQPTSETMSTLGADLLAQALNGAFLTRDVGAGDLVEAQQHLVDWLDHWAAALARTTGDTLLGFQSQGALDGTTVLQSLLAPHRVALTATSLDGRARSTLLSQFLFLGDLFANPPTLADLRNSMNPPPAGPLWTVEATVNGFDCGDGRFATCTANCSAPGDLASCCATPPTHALVCAQATEEDKTLQSGWLLDAVFARYAADAAVSCTGDGDCPAGSEGTCGGSGVCEYPGTTDPFESLASWFELMPPAFINDRAIRQVNLNLILQ